ncbi:hypothetical protein MMC22_008486 [Lobaria immixta]|nr:hypothetical protein [Lobaria immixta]
MNIHTFIDAFIELPQPDFNNDGHPNHWHFSLQPVPGPVNRSVFFIINPSSRVVFKTGLLDLEQYFNQMTWPEVQREWLLHLLIAFAGTEAEMVRPRSWCTDSMVLRDVIAEARRDSGLSSYLPRVFMANDDENSIAYEAWARYFRTLRELNLSCRDEYTENWH